MESIDVDFIERSDGTVAWIFELTSNTKLIDNQMDTKSANEWLHRE